MIQLENISKSFGDQLLYENISLTISGGSRIALVAKNGAGKTTLLNIIASQDEPDSGEVVIKKDIKVGYLPQDPLIDGLLTVLDAIYHTDSDLITTVREYEAAVVNDDHVKINLLVPKMDTLSAWDFEYRAKEILSRLKITDLSQLVSTLSGGQLKRVALARVLIDNPDVLILDEPTNHLDLEMAEWLENYLISSDKTLFMVTHDRYFLDRICTDIYELDHSALYQYKGGYTDYVRKRAERIEQFNQDIEKAQNLFKRELEWMRRMPQARSHKAKYREDAFYDIKDKAFEKRNDKNVEIALGGSRLGTKIFEIVDVNKNFDSKVILKDFSYTFTRYEKLGIVGKNGAGKSTFLNILTGTMTPDNGLVDIGESVKFGYYRQSGMNFDENLKVIDTVKNIAEIVTLSNGSTITVSQLLNHFLFPPETQYNYVYKLSGGEKRRLYLLTILMQNPNFLILDEPTNDLDIMTLNVLEDFLENFGGCLIVVSHDRYFMDKVVDHLMVFEGEGKIRNFEGNYTQYRNAEEEKEEAEASKQKLTSPKKEIITKEHIRKLTFKEKREMEEIDTELPKLEKEKADIENKLSSGSLTPEELISTSKTHGDLTEKIDELSMRWLELSEI